MAASTNGWPRKPRTARPTLKHPLIQPQQLRQCLGRRGAHTGIGQPVQLGRIGVDHHHTCTLLVGLKDQPRCRVDHARGAHHQHQVAGLHRGFRLRQGRRWQVLAKPDHAGAHRVAAGGTGWWLAPTLHGSLQIALRAHRVQPLIGQQIPVQGNHLRTACPLVQTVHVLRHQFQLARVVASKLRQRPVRGIRLHRRHQVPPVGIPLPNPLRVGPKTWLRRHLLRIELRPDAGLHVAERGHPRLGTDARAGQHRHLPGLLQPGAHLPQNFCVFWLWRRHDKR